MSKVDFYIVSLLFSWDCKGDHSQAANMWPNWVSIDEIVFKLAHYKVPSINSS